MAAAYQFTPRALRELRSLCNHIAKDSFEASLRVESAILESCEMLARNPTIGSVRTDVTSLPVRFWVVSKFPNYLLVYRPDGKPLRIVAILHGKRDVQSVLKKPRSF